MKVELTDSQIYILYETVVNNIEDLSYIIPAGPRIGEKVGPKSGKYQYKWDELHTLKDLLYSLIDWEKPSTGTEDVAK